VTFVLMKPGDVEIGSVVLGKTPRTGTIIQCAGLAWLIIATVKSKLIVVQPPNTTNAQELS
jgi:hypothetical protein